MSISKSMDIVDQEQQSDTAQTNRLDKAINRLASRKAIVQIILTIIGFIAELYFGINYINECPIQPLINVFLIVHGCSNLVSAIIVLLGFIAATYIKKSSTPSPLARRLCIASLIGQLVYLIFLIIWLIAGQVWVFGALAHGFQSSNSADSATYCYSHVFWNAFIVIISTYAVSLIIVVVIGVRKIIKRHKMKQATFLKINENI